MTQFIEGWIIFFTSRSFNIRADDEVEETKLKKIIPTYQRVTDGSRLANLDIISTALLRFSSIQSSELIICWLTELRETQIWREKNLSRMILMILAWFRWIFRYDLNISRDVHNLTYFLCS